MNNITLKMAQQIANATSALEEKRTGHQPHAVTVVLSEDILVVTLHEAFSPAEKELAKTVVGAVQVEDYHKQLFANSSDPLRLEINRLSGRVVMEADAVVEPATGSVIHAFSTGRLMQVYLLTKNIFMEPESGNELRPQS